MRQQGIKRVTNDIDNNSFMKKDTFYRQIFNISYSAIRHILLIIFKKRFKSKKSLMRYHKIFNYEIIILFYLNSVFNRDI